MVSMAYPGRTMREFLPAGYKRPDHGENTHTIQQVEGLP
ncbi:hypothetical protein TPY_3003 [Sulfobacillus acidophilus TPY]|nr:hypothetical protein TPY_3003 [Sulfobacillus acidophilus TPY]